MINTKKWMKNIVLVSILIWLFFSPIFSTVLLNASADTDIKIISEKIIIDSNKEIITFVDGTCTEITIKGLGFMRRAEIWTGDIKTMVTLNGRKYPLLNNPNSHFYISYATHIVIPHFIGFRWRESTVSYGVYGIALGNIEWE